MQTCSEGLACVEGGRQYGRRCWGFMVGLLFGSRRTHNESDNIFHGTVNFREPLQLRR